MVYGTLSGVICFLSVPKLLDSASRVVAWAVFVNYRLHNKEHTPKTLFALYIFYQSPKYV